MGILNSLNETSDKAVELGDLYSRKTQEYYKLKVFQQLMLSASMFGKIMIIGGLSFIGLIFLLVSGTIILAQELNSLFLACLFMGALFFAIALFAYLLRSRIEKYIVKKSSKNFFD